MPAKLIEDLGGLRLEVEVREWDDSLFRAVYTIDGHYVASLRCIRTKACPEGMSPSGRRRCRHPAFGSPRRSPRCWRRRSETRTRWQRTRAPGSPS